MLKSGLLLLAGSVVLLVAGFAGARPLVVPMPGPWRMTFFPMGIGLMLLVCALCLLGLAALRRGPPPP